MLGFRGCRLGIGYPEISAMQARAVFEAAAEVQKEGIKVRPEIMIPLVGFKKELDLQIEVVHQAAREVQAEKKVKLNYMVGTMIEIPRGALTADEIAQSAEFFSFGTNDLTQTGLGMSRDDSGSFLPQYQELEIVKKNPFATIDATGVGQLVRDRGHEGPRRASQSEARDLRRARRRSGVDPFLREGRTRLRQLLAVPRARGAPGGGAGGAAESRSGIDHGLQTRGTGPPRLSSGWTRPGCSPDSGVWVWVDLSAPTPDEAEGPHRRLPLSRARGRRRARRDPPPEGRILRRLPVSHPPRHRLQGEGARVPDAGGRFLPGRAVPGDVPRRDVALDRPDRRDLRPQRARARRGPGGAPLSHRRHHGRQLPARSRQARRPARHAREGSVRAAQVDAGQTDPRLQARRLVAAPRDHAGARRRRAGSRGASSRRFPRRCPTGSATCTTTSCGCPTRPSTSRTASRACSTRTCRTSRTS